MQDIDKPIPIQLNLVNGTYIIGRNPIEPYLLPGVKIQEIQELKKEPRKVSAFGFKIKLGKKPHVHNYQESHVEVAGSWVLFRYCDKQFDIAHIFFPREGGWIRYKLYRTMGGKTYDIKPVPEPGEVEPK